MKKIIFSVFLVTICYLGSAQTTGLAGKRFLQSDNIPGETYLRFESNTRATYIMTSMGYTDECPCSCIVSGNKISIKCVCSDKEIYPDPIEDSFTYDAAKGILTSTRYRTSSSGAFFVWNLK